MKSKEVEVTYSSEGIEYLIMNIITNMKALSVKLMQPTRCFKNRLPLKYFAYSTLLQWVSSWYHLGKKPQINGGSVGPFTSLPQN